MRIQWFMDLRKKESKIPELAQNLQNTKWTDFFHAQCSFGEKWALWKEILWIGTDIVLEAHFKLVLILSYLPTVFDKNPEGFTNLNVSKKFERVILTIVSVLELWFDCV